MPLTDAIREEFEKKLFELLKKYLFIPPAQVFASGYVTKKVSEELTAIESYVNSGYKPRSFDELDEDSSLSAMEKLDLKELSLRKAEFMAILGYYYALIQHHILAIRYLTAAVGEEIALVSKDEVSQMQIHLSFLLRANLSTASESTMGMMRAKSFRLTHKAAAAGHVGALNAMAVQYITDAKADGSIPEYEILLEALIIFEMAQDNGSTEAVSNISIVVKRLGEVLGLLEKEALTGNINAQCQLGEAYKIILDKGDNKEAFKILAKRLTAEGKLGNEQGPVTLLRMLSIIYPLEKGHTLKLHVKTLSDSGKKASHVRGSILVPGQPVGGAGGEGSYTFKPTTVKSGDVEVNIATFV